MHQCVILFLFDSCNILVLSILLTFSVFLFFSLFLHACFVIGVHLCPSLFQLCRSVSVCLGFVLFCQSQFFLSFLSFVVMITFFLSFSSTSSYSCSLNYLSDFFLSPFTLFHFLTRAASFSIHFMFSPPLQPIADKE